MSILEIKLLGSPHITIDDEPISVDTRKAIALLAYLAVSKQAHRRSSLTVLLWPESDQQRGRTALRRTLASLNKAIGKRWIEADRTSIGLDWSLYEAGQIKADVLKLRETVSIINQLPPSACDQAEPLLTEASTTYNGRFMEGFALNDSPGFDDWQFFESEQINQDMTIIWSRLVTCLAARADFDPAIQFTRQWIALDPLYETPQLELIKLYGWSGQRSAAIRQYEEYVALLEKELGVEPQPETTAVYKQIKANTLPPPNLPTTQPIPIVEPEHKSSTSLTPPLKPRSHLPRISTSFIGRVNEKELVQSRILDENCRLLTIIGPGGVGKTRIALEVGAENLQNFRHGVFFVPLADIDATNHMAPVMADALGFLFYGRSSLKDQLLNYCSDKEMLIIMDNFEHLLDGVPFIMELLQQAPTLKLIVTSQERLNLREEWLIEMEAFTCPDEANYASNSAYQLFVQRAQQVNPRFAPESEEILCIAQICRFVGGLPLGLELAATWVRLFSPCEIVDEMARNLDFLTSSLQDLPERHRSLQAVFNYAWQLLTDREQETFAKLALFRGSFGIPAALQIMKVSLSSLITLADKSLLWQLENGRYEIPTVLRQYSRAKLKDNLDHTALERSFASFYLQKAAAQEAHLKGEAQKEAVREIMVDIDNIRHAWQLALTHSQPMDLVDAIPAMLLFFEMRSWLEEGVTTFANAYDLISPNEHIRLKGYLLVALGGCLERLGRHEAARERLENGLEILRPLDDNKLIGLALFYLGVAAEAEGRVNIAVEHLEESLEHFRQEKDRWGMATVYNSLGNCSIGLQDYNQARIHYQESLLLRRHQGDLRGIAICYHNMGNVPIITGNYAEACQFFEKSLQITQQINDRRGVGHALNNIGYSAYLLGNYQEAKRRLQESLVMLSEIRDNRGLAHARQNLGHVAFAEKDWQLAETLYTEALNLFTTAGDRVNAAELMVDLGNVAAQQENDDQARHWYHTTLAATKDISADPIRVDAFAGLLLLTARHDPSFMPYAYADYLIKHPAIKLSTRQKLRAKMEEWPQEVNGSPNAVSMADLESALVNVI